MPNTRLVQRPPTHPLPPHEQDHYDVKTICHPILTKLAAIAPGQVRGRACVQSSDPRARMHG